MYQLITLIHRGLSHVVVGFCHLRNLYFLQFCFCGSLLSTLDSLLFCSFIIPPESLFFKLGCSIEIPSKCWQNCVWTQVFFCDMIIMLGGFCKRSRPFFITDCCARVSRPHPPDAVSGNDGQEHRSKSSPGTRPAVLQRRCPRSQAILPPSGRPHLCQSARRYR